MTKSKIKPTPIALVVCDNIYQEPGGKLALVGLFNCFFAKSVPAVIPRLAAFASVTGLRKDSYAKLEIVHSESEDAVVSAEGPFPENAAPTSVVDLHFIFNGVKFPEEGVYFVRFWANGHCMMMRPFKVQTKKGGS